MTIQTVKEWSALSHDFIREFLALNPGNRFILGINSWSESIIMKVPIAAFIDDFTEQTEHHGVPIIKSSQVSPNGLVVNASTVRTWDAHIKLNEIGVRNLDYYSFQRYSDLGLLQIREVPWDLWVLEASVHANEYANLQNLLQDEASRSTLKSILDFRQDCQITKLSNFVYAPFEQYFDFFVDLEEEIFYDVGGYDGMTSMLFAERCPSYKAIKIFEPDEFNIQSIKRNLQNLNNFEIVNVALSDKKGRVGFASGRGSASSIDRDSATQVCSDLGDSFSNPPPTFIKMDIEGGEESALTGLSHTIRSSRPRMAIASYHKPSDLWRITRLVTNLNPSYRVSLRHYTQGQMESVLYFF